GVRTKVPPPRKEEAGRTGKITDVESAMGFGLIDGEDGRRYLYLIGDEGHEIPEKELLIRGREVRFAWKEFPWGPRALRVRGR
ncbi:MAG: hypothetical protein HY760_06270, partial [Nitrospirae bacterium]|nr:hypothetical protein [Nitrospirota bacterium]